MRISKNVTTNYQNANYRQQITLNIFCLKGKIKNSGNLKKSDIFSYQSHSQFTFLYGGNGITIIEIIVSVKTLHFFSHDYTTKFIFKVFQNIKITKA